MGREAFRHPVEPPHIKQKSGMKAMDVPRIHGDVILILIQGGVDAVDNMLAVNGKDAAVLEFWELGQQVGQAAPIATDQFGVQFSQQIPASC